jgi:hypothetical protein
MILDPDDCKQFFKLHKALTLFVNERLKLFKRPARTANEIVALPIEQRNKLREALVEHVDLIDAFVEENPFGLNPEELGIVSSWHDLVAGEFSVLRFLKKYTVFMTARRPPVAYGVVALSEPLGQVIQDELPFFCKAVLLPFRGRIVYDGVLSGYDILIGSNIRRELKEACNDAKKRHGIFTRLPWRAETPKAATTRRPARKKQGGGLAGRWRITWMESWDQEFVDDEVEGFLQFDRAGGGRFQLGYFRGTIDHRAAERDGKPAVEFSWDGTDEMDPVQGRGWAVLDGGEIERRITIDRGDESAFRAVKKGS